MLKSDLKDGYLLTLNSGDQYYYCNGYGLHVRHADALPIFKYNQDLTYNGLVDMDCIMDIIAVSHWGEVLWLRK
jgi:hypothetical protein